MSLFARIAWTAAALFAGAVILGLTLYRPTSQRGFVERSDGLLREAEAGFAQIAASLVDQAVSFAAAASLAEDEQRARSLNDLPFSLYTDTDGALEPARLREALRVALTDPGAAVPEKHAAVRAEILERTRADVRERLDRLRQSQQEAAARHGDAAARRSVAAWGGLMLVLLAAGALVLDRVVVRPVRAATEAVVRFGAGARGVRAEVAGSGETAALARAFNETAAAVERAEAENAELRSRLEEKVRERTAALVRAARASTAGTMAGGIAHEFNNLLGGILGCAEAALEENPAPAVAEPLEMIRKTARRGVNVTRALLNATRAEPAREPCVLGDLLEEAVAEVRPPPGIDVVRDVAPVAVDADPAMLRQVFSNLVRNAVLAMGGSGRLALTVRARDGAAEVAVADDGPGVDPAVREVLFEPFVTTRRGGREGAGLGLFLADRLVGAHGGRIDVDSEPGKGATFTVRLPSARDS